MGIAWEQCSKLELVCCKQVLVAASAASAQPQLMLSNRRPLHPQALATGLHPIWAFKDGDMHRIETSNSYMTYT